MEVQAMLDDMQVVYEQGKVCEEGEIQEGEQQEYEYEGNEHTAQRSRAATRW